jgi:hypothetical protein
LTSSGTLTFWWRVSSEAFFDTLRLYVDGIEQASISGETSWQQRSVTLGSGSHTVEWRYSKDSSESRGADAGWVDQVTFAGSHTVTATAGSGGEIFPSGNTTVNSGGSVPFTARPFSCHVVDQWLVNGSVVRTGGTDFTLANIQANTTMHVTFRRLTYTVTASAAPGGSISPSGVLTRNCGDSQGFTATPGPNYEVDRWLVNGVSQQVGGRGYFLPYIDQNLTVQVTFYCLYSIEPTSASFGAEGGAGRVNVTTAPTCAWSANVNVPWLGIDSVPNGVGPGSVSYSVAPNLSAGERNGTVTVAGHGHSVRQAGRSQPTNLYVDCTYAGMDSDGSLPRPYRTVMAAYQAAINGDTLRLFACNYCETLTLSTPLRLEATNGLVNIGCQ